MHTFLSDFRLSCLAVAGVWVIAAAPASAQQVSEARLQELMAQARTLVQAPQPGQPASAVKMVPSRVVDLTMDEAVRMTIDQNIDISVQRLNPQIQDLSLASAKAAYRPTASATLGDRSSRTAGTSQLSGGSVIDQSTFTYNGGVTQALPWIGTTLNVNFNNNRLETTSNNATVNPNFTSLLQASVTQPLLRNRAIDTNRQSILTTQISRDIADVAVKTTITNTVASARSAYWDLVYAIQAVDAARQSLDLAQKLVEDNQTRVEIGTMAPIDVVSAQAEVATRQQTLVAAESTRKTSELALKRLLVGSTQDPLWEATINPTDRPPAGKAEPIDLASAIRGALQNRTDVITARENMKSSDITMRYLRNQTLPGIDLTATYSAQGTGGTGLVRDKALGGAVVGTTPGGYVDALSAVRKVRYPSWVLSLVVSYPIGVSSQDASYARAKVQLQQSQAQLRALELTVATDLTNAAMQVQNYLQQVQAAAASRELAQRKLEAEQSKFEVGMSTNYLVVQAQRDLRDAMNSELRATLNYRKSLVDFERLQVAGSSSGGVSAISVGGGGSTTSSGSSRAGGTGGPSGGS